MTTEYFLCLSLPDRLILGAQVLDPRHACLLNESASYKKLGLELRRPYHVPSWFQEVPPESWFGPKWNPIKMSHLMDQLPTGDR